MTSSRLGRLRKGCISPQVAEHHGNLTPMALQQLLAARGDEEFGQMGRERRFPRMRDLVPSGGR